MSNDQQRPTDKSGLTPKVENVGKAKDNIAQITRALERKAPQIKYKAMTDGQGKYDKATNTIIINKENEFLEQQDPVLLEPLLEHERVHAQYKGDDPYDEISLQAYIDEEIEAYQAQVNVWETIKSDYANPGKRAALGDAGKKLIGYYDFCVYVGRVVDN